MYQILTSVPKANSSLRRYFHRPDRLGISKSTTLPRLYTLQTNHAYQSHQSRQFQTMPKAKAGKRNSAPQGTPYDVAKNHVFKMNTDIGQHVLKNPGIAQVGSTSTISLFIQGNISNRYSIFRRLWIKPISNKAM